MRDAFILILKESTQKLSSEWMLSNLCQKSRLRETPNLSTDADSSTDTVFAVASQYFFKNLYFFFGQKY